MPLNCKNILAEDVVKFFEYEIDGMGKSDGHFRNEGVPDSIRQSREWKFCELTEQEFMNLTIPDNQKPLLKDKINMQFDSDLDYFVKKNLKILESGNDLSPLIVRIMLPSENPESSFFIEDGAHRAITLGVYFKSKSYKPVKAYIGQR